MIERMFYPRPMRVEYRIEPCKSALTRVRGMPFNWSLNPYMGCAHMCTFCYVRHFEQRADRPSDDRYGRSIRVKPKSPRCCAASRARVMGREEVALGTATDPYQPAEGRFRLTRGCLAVLDAGWTPFSIVTRGPLVVRDIDVLQAAGRRAGAEVCFSVPTLDERVWRRTEPGTAPPASRLEAVRRLADAGVEVGVGIAPILPGLSDAPAQLEAVFAPRVPRARGLSGRASSTCDPACASTSSRHSPATGPRRSSATRRSSRRGRTSPRRRQPRSWSPYGEPRRPTRGHAGARLAPRSRGSSPSRSDPGHSPRAPKEDLAEPTP